MKTFKVLSTWVGLFVFISVSAVVLHFESSRNKENYLHISANPWVGFTPIAYAQEKGWIDHKSFRFSWHVDMSESAKLYDSQLIDGFLSTQYEVANVNVDDAAPPKAVLLIDSPNSHAVILSNFTLDQLSNYKNEVLVYLDNDALMKDFLHSFISSNQLSHVKFKFITEDMHEFPVQKNTGSPIVIVTCAPYSTQMIAHGYKVIKSNEHVDSFRFINAMFISASRLIGREGDIKALKESIERAKDSLSSNPVEFYEVVRPYLDGLSYDEFMTEVSELEWANEENNNTLINQLKSNKIDTSFIIL